MFFQVDLILRIGYPWIFCVDLILRIWQIFVQIAKICLVNNFSPYGGVLDIKYSVTKFKRLCLEYLLCNNE